MAAAITIANDKGYVTLPEKYSNPQSIATIADKTVETIKIAHDVATGELSADNAVDYGIKKAAAVVKTVVGRYINTGAKIVAAKVTAVVSAVFPPAAIIAPVIYVGTKFVASKVKQEVAKDINKIAEVAKPIVKAAVTKVKEVATRVWEKAKSVGRKILSCFGF